MNDKNILIDGGVDLNKSLELLEDMETYDETLDEFLNLVDDKIEKLKEAKDRKDIENYITYVHSLKSDGRYLGFTDFADMAMTQEMECKDGNFDYVIEHFDELMEELYRIIEVCKKYLVYKPIIEIPDESTHKDYAILVVDDSNLIRSFIARIFNDKYEVIESDDGKKAIEIIENDKDNGLVGMFLDLHMPHVNGFEVLDYLKEHDMFDKLPVSIISGNCDQDAIDKAFKYPIIDMLSKPFTESDVTRIVERTVLQK